IYRSAEHLLSVINDILDFSKIEAGEMRVEKADFDLDTCIESVIEMVAPLAEEKGIELNILVDSSVSRKLVGDSGRLKQILLNLTGNAIKFTDRGQVFVHITVKRGDRLADDKQSPKLLFSVRDTGIGISPEGQTKLFQSFSQVDASPTRMYGGTGLGLAICKQLVEMMGGEIGVRSFLGNGSTFWFSVPLEKQLQSESRATKLAGKKLLVVSANALRRAAVRSLAQSWGAHCDEAETPAAALTWLKNTRGGISEHSEEGENFCDAVLVDLQMPDFDAEEFGLKVRSIQGVGWLIAMTALREQPKAEALCSVGFSGYLIEPVRPSRLLEALLASVKETGEFKGLEAANNCKVPSVNFQSVTPNSPSALRILLAEDHPINQQVIVEQLAALGYQADCAANGQEALERLAKKAYNLVLMDCQMPVLDGYETTKKLREREKGEKCDWNHGLLYAAKSGNSDLVQYFISKGAKDWNWALYFTSIGGHKHLVDFFIQKATENGGSNFNLGLKGSIKGNHVELVKFFLAKGADAIYSRIRTASKNGNREIVELLIVEYIRRLRSSPYKNMEWYKLFLRRGISGAKDSNNRDMVLFLEEKLKNLVDL
ncbi:MAG: ATP-binding protein, partial [Microcoleus sp.]